MRVRGNLIALSLLLLAAASPALAVKKSPPKDSEVACVNWCFDHNKTTPSRDECLNQCECYYHGNLCGRVLPGKAPLSAAPQPKSKAP